MKKTSRASDLATLWRVHTYGQERWPVGARYWFENKNRHQPEVCVIQLTTEGSIVHCGPRGEQTVTPGQFIIFRHGEETSYGDRKPFREPYTCRWLSIEGAGVMEHYNAFIDRHGPVHTADPKHAFLINFNEWVDSKSQATSDPIDLSMRTYSLFMQLFDLAESRLMNRMRPVEQAVQSLLRNPFRPWSMKQLAANYGVSREHLSRVFQEKVGTAPHAWLTEARIKRALTLLRETQLPIGKVAQQSGYADTHTLARQVRNTTGLSPTACREQSH